MRSFSLLFLALAACPAPAPETEKPTEAAPARFADASEEERLGAVQTALGFGAVWATMVQMQADGDARSVDDDNQPSGCPELDVLLEEPYTVRYSAEGCVGPSGSKWDGVLEVENPLTWEDAAEDPSGKMRIVADNFTMGEGPAALRFDGTFTQSDIAMGADYTATIDLAATMGGQTWLLVGGTTMKWEDDRAHQTCDEGLRGEVSGLGSFDVACDIYDFGTAVGEGFLELHGEDTLRVDMTPDEDGCFPATIDGVATDPICMGGGEEPEGELDSDVFGGSGIGTGGGFVAVDTATVIDEVAVVEIALSAGDAVEVHPLTLDDDLSDEMFDGWLVSLAIGETYEAGVTTTFGDTDAQDMVGVFFAYDADGELIGCMINAWGTETGAVDVSACPRK